MDLSTRRPLGRIALSLAVAGVAASTVVGGAVAQSPSAAPTPPPTIAPVQPPALPAPTLPAPEQAVITVGYELPNLNSRAPLLIALDRGYFTDAGFTDVQLIQVDQALPGLVGGSLNFGIVGALDAAAGAAEGLPIASAAGWQNYTANIIAVRPEITSPADLAGKDIVLGGTPGSADADLRLALLKEAGWDLEGVAYNAVTPEGFSNAWVQLFADGLVSLTPAFNRHRQAIADAGGQIVVDRFDYGSDLLATNKDWAAANPNTVTAFQAALIRALADMSDPANNDYVFSLGEREGITITDGIKTGWANDQKNFQNFDGGWGDPTKGGGLQEITDYFTNNLESVPDLTSFLLWENANAAQAALGLPANPAPAS
jgi:ABC-type nitrate/sulfonate/bicarbonate transport system substrate-binding protein